jgi:hypothetical protein
MRRTTVIPNFSVYPRALVSRSATDTAKKPPVVRKAAGPATSVAD